MSVTQVLLTGSSEELERLQEEVLQLKREGASLKKELAAAKEQDSMFTC